jgi:hypothetical protein
MRAEPEKSLGIVTLNQTQRDLLLVLIERFVPREPFAKNYIDRWEGTLGPFFVKNLENVQCDERDVIFMSTVYGPDAATGVVKNRPINGAYGRAIFRAPQAAQTRRVRIGTARRRPADRCSGGAPATEPCGSVRSPADAGQETRPLVLLVISVGFTQRVGV